MTMSAPFNPIKAQAERVDGLQQIYRLLNTRRAHAERSLAEAEADYNALTKMAAFMSEQLELAVVELQRLRAQAEGATT